MIHLSHHLFFFRSEHTVFFRICGRDISIEPVVGACVSFFLHFSGGTYFLPHLIATLSGSGFLQVQNIHRLQLHTQINTV